MTIVDTLQLLIDKGHTNGLADKTRRLCMYGLISTTDRDMILAQIVESEINT